jgi:hypothetical protein
MPHARPRILALILLEIALVLLVHCIGRAWGTTRLGLPKRIRRLRPRMPDDCSTCRLSSIQPLAVPPLAVHPWREGRSRRGVPRWVPNDGDACRRPGCRYRGITDARIHALVADGLRQVGEHGMVAGISAGRMNSVVPVC